MSTRLTRSAAVCALVLLLALPALAADFPTDGRPIMAKVIDVTDGNVTLETPHGRFDLAVAPDVARRLNPGDVVVLRIIDDEDDAPSASPREEPATPEPATRI